MRGCAQGELRVSEFSSFLVFGVPKKLYGGIVTAAKPFFSPRTGRDNKKKILVREMKEKGIFGVQSERIFNAFELTLATSGKFAKLV